ncbi:MAG: DUF2442 domain-containing protein [Pseudomonadota bacterium]|nr:DUF2442 domain-containing protein [Pseudomonadota bacterium]
MVTFDPYDERYEPVSASCTDSELTVVLKDGRHISAPLWWYPTLHRATPEQRANYEIMPLGIHWPDIDEDISVRGLMLGNKAPNAVPPVKVPEPAE